MRFTKFSQKKSLKYEKLPTYLKWDLKIEDFVPTRSRPDGTVIFREQEEIEYYEQWSRHQALKLWNQLHPKKKRKAEDFFVGDLNLPKHADGSPQQAKGDLEQIMYEECFHTKLEPKKNKPKTKSEPTSPDKLRSALKGKQKIFYLESKSGRNYFVDSMASFHLVSRDELTEQEISTIIALDEPIPIQTANGEVQLNEKS